MWSGFLGALLGGGGDRIPAALNWTIAASTVVSVTEATNSQTISGINRSITLRITASATATMEYRKNGGSWTSISSGGQVSVANTNTIEWRMSVGPPGGTVTFSVYNDSAGGTLLDTFACNWITV